MATIEFNGIECEAKAGENLLAIARRKAVHIWFVCDGRGLCRTCECHVLEGNGCLGEPTEKERALISEKRRSDGYRLACQVKLLDTTAVRVVSRAEELRRIAARILIPEEGSKPAEEALRLTRSMIELAAGMVTGLPYVASHIVPQIAATPPTLSGLRSYIADTVAVLEHTLEDLS
jgi:ferredoxin